jgi:porin
MVSASLSTLALEALLAQGAPSSDDSWLDAQLAAATSSSFRDSLAASGIALAGTWTAELAQVFKGGVEQRGTFHNLLDLNLTFDPEPLLSIPGATIYVDAYAMNGRLVADDVGDWQYVSNIDADPVHQIAEVWWEQRFLDGAIRAKVGKVDANSEFGWVENGSMFLHSGLSYPSTVGLPLYPDPATSVNLFVAPDGPWSVGVGCYDGAGQEGISTGGRGPQTFLGEPADLFWIGEATVRWALRGDTLPGRLAVGAALHTGTFQRFEGGTEKGTKSFYGVLDQAIWRERPDDADDDEGVGVAAIVDRADADVSEAAFHSSIGIHWRGLVPDRDQDVIGIAASWLQFSREAGFTEDYELAVELVWRVQVTPRIALSPDVQYVVHPGGNDSLENAVVGLLRLEITL